MEEKTENLTDDTQVDASLEKAAAGDEAESVATDGFSLAQLNELTGQNYKDVDTALKSIKDMQSQAGKAADLEGKLKAAQKSDDGSGKSDDQIAALTEQLNQLQQDTFYSQNPEVNRALAETIAKANNLTPQEAIETDLYKDTVGTTQKKTVADSNARVAAPKSDFNPEEHSGDAMALAKYVEDNFIKKS